MAVAWKETISFYEDIVEDGFEFVPLLALVKRIAESSYSGAFYPSTSHFILCVSTVDDYQMRMKRPMVAIQSLTEHMFRIDYWKRPLQTHDLQRIRCHSSQAWTLIQGMFLKLDLESRAVDEQSNEAGPYQRTS